MPIKWTEAALDDLANIQAYIAKDSVFYARQFIERIFDTVEKLETFPEIGRKVPEAEERNDIRELIFQRYRIIYLVETPNVYIIGVVHGARNLSTIDDKPWNRN